MNRHSHYCCVPWCPSNQKTYNKSLSYFRVPVGDRGKAWLLYAGRQDLLDQPAKKVHNYRVCGAHFTRNCFTSRARTWLKSDAIPTVKPEKCISRTVRSHSHAKLATAATQKGESAVHIEVGSCNPITPTCPSAVPASGSSSLQGFGQESTQLNPSSTAVVADIKKLPKLEPNHVVPESVCTSIQEAPGLPESEPTLMSPATALTAASVHELSQLQPGSVVPASVEAHSHPELPELPLVAAMTASIDKFTQLQPRHVVPTTESGEMQEDPELRRPCEPRLPVSTVAATATNLNKLPELRPKCVALSLVCNGTQEYAAPRSSEPRLLIPAVIPTPANLNAHSEAQPVCVVLTSVRSSKQECPGSGSIETTQPMRTIPSTGNPGNLLGPKCVILVPASPISDGDNTVRCKGQKRSVAGIAVTAANQNQFLESQSRQVLLAPISSGKEEYPRLGCSGSSPAVATTTATSARTPAPQHTWVPLASTSNRIQECPELGSREPAQLISGSEFFVLQRTCVPSLVDIRAQEHSELGSRGPTQPISHIAATAAVPSELLVLQHTCVPALMNSRVQESPELASRLPAQLISSIPATATSHSQVPEPQSARIVLAPATSDAQNYSGHKQKELTQPVPVITTTPAHASKHTVLQHTCPVPALTSNKMLTSPEFGSEKPTPSTSGVAVMAANPGHLLELQAKHVVHASTSILQERSLLKRTALAHTLHADTSTNSNDLFIPQHTPLSSKRMHEGPKFRGRALAQSISNDATTMGNRKEIHRLQHSWIVLASARGGMQRDPRLRSRKCSHSAASHGTAKIQIGSSNCGGATPDTVIQPHQNEVSELKSIVKTMQQEIASLKEETATLTKRVKRLET